jgi:lysophospholipase L1-like esterase
MVKPHKILLLLVLVNLLLLGVIFIFPSGVIPLAGNYKLKFISLEELLHPKTVSKVDIDNIVKNVSDSSLHNHSGASAESAPDTLVLRDDPRQMAKITYKIQYPDDRKNALDALFVSLDSLEKNDKLFRILHYGDSQIEGDRISSTLREMLQLKFGGSGTGLIPIYEPNASRHTIQITQSDNWIKYAIYGGLFKNYDSRKYSMLCSAFRYYLSNDSSKANNLVKAWVHYHKLISAYPHAKKYERMNLFYGKVPAPGNIIINTDKKQHTIFLDGSDKFNIKTLDLDNSPENIELDFTNVYSPDVYGISLDSKKGIAVDNVPMRGSSGTDFGRMDLNYLTQQIKRMNVRLMIFQYGVNVVPYVIDNYDFYEKTFYANLKKFKDQNPDISILVIGVSDMSKKDGNNYVSYPNIERIRDAQKRAAFRAGCAYWDLYEAMGGKNSMSSWVDAKPDALAEKDYTHFNARGARIIGEMIFNALMNEYYNHKGQKKKGI